MTKIRLAYACLLGFAAGLPVVRSWVLEHTNWTPLAIAYPLKATTLAPSEFTVDRTGVYEIVLKIARPPAGTDRDRAECLMGWDWGNEKWGQSARGQACRVAAVVNLDWRLVPLDGGPPSSGSLHGIADGGGFSVDDADRQVTAFSAKRGQRYRFEGRTAMDATPLEFVRPRIVVQPTGTTNEDEIVTTLAYWAVAAVAGVAGLWLLVSDFWKLSRRAA